VGSRGSGRRASRSCSCASTSRPAAATCTPVGAARSRSTSSSGATRTGAPPPGTRRRDEDGTSRYLPAVAWELLSPAERRATERGKHAADEQHVANTAAAKEAREAAELLTLRAPEAQRRVRAMTTVSALERARTAEQEHGKGRTTVLRVVEQRLRALG